jgi:alpha-galactosidase
MCRRLGFFHLFRMKDSTKGSFYGISLFLMSFFMGLEADQLNAQMLNFQYLELAYRAEKPDAPLETIRIPFGKDTVNNHFQLKHSLDTATNRIRIDLRAFLPLHLERVKLVSSYQSGGEDSRYFCNGFQSWTTSREYQPNERIRKLSPLLKAYSWHAGDYFIEGPKRKKGLLHSWSWTYWRTNNTYYALASLAEVSAYTAFRFNTKEEELSLDKVCQGYRLLADKSFELFDVVYQEVEGYEAYQEFMNEYAALWHQKYGSSFPNAKAAQGWTSWYNYYDKIDEEIIEQNLKAFHDQGIDIDIFQIDDGYQAAIGDWLTPNKKFPSGMAAIADKIHERGYRAGLWLAPFIVGKNSAIYKAHPDWIVRKKNGKPLKIAKNVIWKTTYYALDLSKAEVRRHIKKVVHTILHEWNYDMIKVDFLFALSVQGRKDRTTAQILRDGMQLLREAAGSDKQILGCGLPLAPCFGLVDYCRIGNDAHLGWEFGVLKRLQAHERPSTWSTLTNTIMRAPLAGNFFLNDPDVFILRKKKTKLSPTQKETMFLVNHLFGQVLFNSDYIKNYNPEAKAILASSFPLKNPIIKELQIFDADLYRVQFKIGVRTYIAYINLNKKAQKIQIPAEDQFYFNPKTAEVLNLEQEKGIRLAPFESKCFYLVQDDELEILGGQGHLYSGSEIERLSWNGENQLELYYHPQIIQKKPIYIRLKNEATTSLYINGKAFKVKNFDGFRGILYQP